MKRFFIVLLFPFAALSMDHEHGGHHHEMNHGNHLNGPPCAEMEWWDMGMNMCMPVAGDMEMRMLMLSGGAFGGYTVEEGPRGRNAVWSTSMVMADLGTTVGQTHYLNLDVMLTAEKWTLPRRGYPLLLQIGEEADDHVPFIDAQHPHSTPFMGITLSDTLTLGESTYLKLFFAPRGEATEGPLAFMHRETGRINPDAPLGHHVGQDVGHISSTVFGGSAKIGDVRLELSTFHGEEPQPTRVDLPVSAPDSAAVRVGYEFSDDFLALASYAYVAHPEHDDPDISHVNRVSASVYPRFRFGEWRLSTALVYGGIAEYDHASFLNSFGLEYFLERGDLMFWGRWELLERTPRELTIASADPDRGRWAGALTFGYTHTLARFDGLRLGLGGSVTKDILPAEFRPAYGGAPWSAKVFLNLRGMQMFDL